MDSSELRTAAVRGEMHADAIRGGAALLVRHRDAMRWQSPAARACRARLDDVVAHLMSTARRADDVADLLRTQAAVVSAHP